jgi:hypothetical protein
MAAKRAIEERMAVERAITERRAAERAITERMVAERGAAERLLIERTAAVTATTGTAWQAWSTTERRPVRREPATTGGRRCHRCGEPGHFALECHAPSVAPPPEAVDVNDLITRTPPSNG